MSDTDYSIDTYRLHFDTPSGEYDVDLIGTGLEIAVKRAIMTLVAKGFGDFDEIILLSWERIDGLGTY